MATPTQTTAITTTQQNSLDAMRNAKKQLLSGGSRFVLRLNDGDQVRLHVLREMTQGIVISLHPLEGIPPYKAVCAAEIGKQCEYCQSWKGGEWKLRPTKHMYLPIARVIEGDDGKKVVGVRLLELYVSKRRTIYDILDDHFNDNGTITSCDFVYSRKGKSKEETTYGFTAQISNSIFKPETLTRLASSATDESIWQGVLETYPVSVVGNIGNSPATVESDLAESPSSDEYIPGF